MPHSSTDDLDDERCLDAFIETAATLQGLPIEAGWQSAVAAHFRALCDAARLINAAPLDDLIESAATFTP